MTIEDKAVVDIISTSPDGGSVTLTTTDHLEWGSAEHLLTIQEKLNSYLAFIESGEIYDTYPNAKGKVIAIKVMCMYPPDDEGRVFFEKCREVINSAGFNFFYAVKEI